MLTITIEQHGKTATAEIPSDFAPALRSALTEMRNELGGRASGAHRYEREDALARALNATATLAAALNTVVPEDDPHYA